MKLACENYCKDLLSACKFLTPATPADSLSTNSEAGKSEAFCGGQGLVGSQLPARPCWDCFPASQSSEAGKVMSKR